MASTRFPAKALDTARFFVKQLPVDRVGEDIVRRALQRLWNAAPFTWTVGSGTSFQLVAGQGEYEVALPSDFSRAIKADQVERFTLVQRELQIVSHIEADDGYKGQPSKIYFAGPEGDLSVVRVSPVPASLSGDPRITWLYKKVAPVYTGASIHNVVVPFPDDWYYVFEELVLYEAYRYSDDSRAGDVIFRGEGPQLNGQAAVAAAALADMVQREPQVILTGIPAQKDSSK